MSSRTRARVAGFPPAAHVPVHLTPLVGRAREMDELAALFRTHRLVSLVGAGGSGKTRLAAAVAEAHRAAAWIDLAPLADPMLVPSHTAGTLGLRDHAGGAPLDSLIDRFGRGAALLVLDNCEHLLLACARLADALLRGCPGLRILTTSRQALGVAGEKVWPVPPLALPDSDGASAAESGAVQLFVQRAQDVLSGFSLTPANLAAVVHVCRRLDGLPLAIELAAARVRLLPPEQLARRLDSTLSLLTSSSQLTLPRHRTLRALIDWSYELLSADERLLLERLAVFAGGFSLDAAEAVVSDDTLPTTTLLDVLAGLVDRSLVTVREHEGEARYALIETVRQYAQERLSRNPDAEALHARHAAHYLELAEAAEPHVLGGARGTVWMTRLEQEQGNLRAAMEWCAGQGEHAEMELRFGAALLWFHFTLGQFAEPRGRLQNALERGAGASPRLRGRALTAMGYLAFWMGDHAAVYDPLVAAAELLAEAEAPLDRAFALTGLATIVGLSGDRVASSRLFDQAQRALGDPGRFWPGDFPPALLYAFASYWRGSVAQAHGDLGKARSAYETSVHIGRRFGNHPTIGHPLAALARVLTLQGEHDAAETCLVESAPIHVRNDDRWGLIQVVEVAALLAVGRGRMERAARMLGAADQIRAQIGVRLAPHERQEREGVEERIRSRLGAEEFERTRAGGAALVVPQLLREIVEAPVDPAAPPPGVETIVERFLAPATVAHVAEADLCVRALGPLQIFVAGRPLDGDAFGSSRPRELLLLLLSHPEGCTRDQLGLAFWPEASAAQVKNSFHVTLHRLRRALEQPDWIVISGERYRLDPAVRVDFDVRRFETETRAALQQEGAEAAERLAAALALYRGDFLEGEAVGDWHLELRDRLRDLYLVGLLALGRREMASGRFAPAAEAFKAVLARDPLHEEACRQLMICHARTGARVEAIRLYENLRVLLREELDTEPEEETTMLYRGL